MQQLPFGKAPTGKRLERIRQSPNYRDGAFQNLSLTPALSEGVGYYKVMKEFFCNKDKRNIPLDAIPTQKTDLKSLPPGQDALVWFGHSSYFMQLEGKKILVDPVFSGNASPVNFTTRAFKGSDAYTVDDLPEIDYLFITHDHYDHLDYRTIVQLNAKVRQVIMGLGVGGHLEHWGYDAAKLVEKDWHEHLVLDDKLQVYTTPARHFSGRGLKRNNTLWMSYVLETPTRRIYIGGDSGYDTHFAEIGSRFGPFDLAMLENGQYDDNWKYIHMRPEQVVQAARDLGVKTLFPVHWSKFALGAHAWDEPIQRVTREAARQGVPLIHPMIGELVVLGDNATPVSWWEGLR
ncbi:MAG: MBL fold metallo-hydrolase [Flavipsychrobacter sp.]|nr:MBL fold metallo-hydrolase [Flavipsychrobacter sp.]